jgi:ComEC/Rec2-related protein
LQALAIRSRRWLQAELGRGLEDSPEIASLITSMVLGLRSDTPEEMQDLFRRTGTLHLFAVSGLNIAMLALIAWFILKPLGIRRLAAVFAIVPILGAYAILTGLSASCVRAAIMGALVVLAHLFDRRALVYNSLAAAAVVILAWDTNQLFSPGFQFSFVLVFAIVGLSRIIQRRFERIGAPDPFLPRSLWTWPQRLAAGGGETVAASLGVTLSAWIGSLLFSAGYFHLFSASAILANMVAVPLAFVILALGLGSALTATFSTAIAVLFNNANWLCAKILLWLVQGFASLPGGHLYVELPRFAQPPDCEFTVLDVGSGAAIHLRAGEADWLIDGGPTVRYRQVTLPYLRSRGVNFLDAFLLSHGDAQHIGSASHLVDDFAPRCILDSPVADRSSTRKTFRRTLAGRQRGVAFCQRGDLFQLSPETTLRVLHPPAGLRRNAADDKALVLLLESGSVRTLFTSDSGFLTERWLLEHDPALRVDLLVRGQHPKEFSGTPDFLARLAPQVAICPAAGFGEPRDRHAAWRRQSEDRGITVFSQEECGAVAVAINGGGFVVRSFLNGQTFRSRAR